MTGLVVTRDRGVGAHDLFVDGGAVWESLWECGGDGDVLPDWEAED